MNYNYIAIPMNIPPIPQHDFTILLVDDRPENLLSLEEILLKPGRRFVTAQSGNEALKQVLKHEHIGLIMLDVQMPEMDGFEVARILKSNPRTKDISIIFVTAKVQTEDLLKGFEVGGNDYLRKPFSMEELIVRINNLLQLAGGSKNTVSQDSISIGQYHFVPVRYELRIGDRIKQLSHRESTLLQALIENKNATVLRKDILMKLWGDDSFFNSRNLDVYITKLRDYLKEDPAIKIITIKGIGYHFSVG